MEMVIVAHSEGAEVWRGRGVVVRDISDHVVVTLHCTGVHSPSSAPSHAP